MGKMQNTLSTLDRYLTEGEIISLMENLERAKICVVELDSLLHESLEKLRNEDNEEIEPDYRKVVIG